MKKKINSVQGKILRRLIKDVTDTHIIGKGIKSGEFRKNPIEPKWVCPKGYSVEEVQRKNYTMEITAPAEIKDERVILQLHGGGYIGPMKNIYRTFAIYYCKALGEGRVVTIDYRVAPENPYPAALEDAVDAYEYLLEQGISPKNIIVAGDSAGGGLTLALIMYLRDKGYELPKAVITMSAWTDLTCENASYETNFKNDPLFGNTKDSMIYDSAYIGAEDPKNPYISPVYGKFNDFPPMLMQVGSIEMLLDDTLEVAKKAKNEGCDVKYTIYEDMFHVFQMSKMLIPESRAAWEEVREFLSLHKCENSL